MRKHFLSCLFIWLCLNAEAQITMTVETPGTGIITKPQLWNVLLSNGAEGSTLIHLELTLSDISSGDPVLSAYTSTFSLTGTKQFLAADLSPITYEYFSGVAADHDPSGYLPLGTYHACYKLFDFNHSSGEPLLENCIDITVEPISPPLLNMPEDESVTDVRTPQFTWLPPAALNMFDVLSYDLKLVEVTEGQTSTEAIENNTPVFEGSSNADIFLNYPVSSAPLDTAKTYAWQVIAKNDNAFAAQSDIWTFRVKGDTLPLIPVNENPYVQLRRGSDVSLNSCQGILKFDYYNDAADSAITYNITSLEEGDLGDIVKNGTLNLGSGENLIGISFMGDERLVENKTYLFELFNSRNEVWAMKFIYHQLQNNQ